jgi:hypothetical protein
MVSNLSLSVDQASTQRRRTLTDKLGFGLLILLLILQPFHFWMQDIFVYYRELFAALFAILFLLRIASTYEKHSFHNAEALLIVFLLFIGVHSLLIKGNVLYDMKDITDASLQLTTVDPTLYVLRNAVLYIPMVLYFSARGLTAKEITLICRVVSITAIFSVLAFLNYRGVVSQVDELISVLQYGSSNLSYNTYVPYLTFPALTSIYLYLTERRRVVRLFYLTIYLVLFVYIVVSSSRQSIIFVLLILIWFFLFTERRLRQKLSGVFLAILALSFLAGFLVSTDWLQNERLLDKISVDTLIDNTRIDIMQRGLDLLPPEGWVWGMGLDSVVFSGPHNDYIRWIQRVGVPGMVLSFLPFLIGFILSFRRARKAGSEPVYLLLSGGLLFLIYHSMFGYPREDAYQSLYVFLALAMWLAVEKHPLTPRDSLLKNPPASAFYAEGPLVR